MIKKLKYLLTFFVLCLWIINFSIAWYTRQFWVYWYNPYKSTIDIKINNDWTFYSDVSDVEKKIFLFDWESYWFWNSDWLFYYVYNANWQWILSFYKLCDTLNWNETNKPWNCSEAINVVNDWTTKDFFWNFLSNITNNDYYYFSSTSSWWSWHYDLCLSSSVYWKSLCFYFTSWNYYRLENSSISMPYKNYWNISDSLLYNAPVWNGGWDWWDYQEIVWIELWSDESAINYFENHYWRNESICYAWIDNVTTNWWTSVSFQEWTWLNIFQVFSWINNMSPDLNKVYVRLNSRLINYEQWFGRSGDPLYLSNYNTWTNQVDLYYDNLTFPFSNNPVAVYFLASNISVHSEYSTMWSEIVSYCNLKINNWTFDEIIDQAVKNNITRYTEQSNKNNWLNPDWTVNIINYNNFWIYTGDVWVSSGVEISFTWNTTVKNSLINFFDRINDVYNDINVSWSVNSILPKYIIYGLLLVILFKLLKRK